MVEASSLGQVVLMMTVFTVLTDYNSSKNGISTFFMPFVRYPNGEMVELGTKIKVMDYEGFFCYGILIEIMRFQGERMMGRARIDYDTLTYPKRET